MTGRGGGGMSTPTDPKPLLFGWCQGTGHHESCRVDIGGTNRAYHCECSCHKETADAS